MVKPKDSFEEYLEASGISMPVLTNRQLKEARREHKKDSAARQKATREELETKGLELDRMHEAWKGRNIFGVFDATIFCDEPPRVPLPSWALHFWAQELASSLEARRSGAFRASRRRGRHTRPTVRYAEALRDRVRYENVEDCREHHDQIERVHGRDVYEQARILLEHSPAAGSKRTIERAYKKVKRAIAQNSSKYYVSKYCRRFFPEFYFGYGPRILSLLKK